MQTDFQRALAATLVYEGGWSDNAADPGGATMYGVTQAVYSAWLRAQGKPSRTVRAISRPELETIYKTRYWDPVTQGRTWPLNAVLFDVAVNSGVGTANALLAEAKLNTPFTVPDRMRALALAVCDARESFFRGIVVRRPASKVFLKGWLRRCDEQRALCQT